MKLGKAFLLVFLVFLFEPLISQPIAKAVDPAPDSVWIVAPDSTVAGKSFSIPIYVSNSKVLGKITMNFAFKLSSVVRLDTISFSDTSCRLYNSPIFDHRKLFRIPPDKIRLEVLG